MCSGDVVLAEPWASMRCASSCSERRPTQRHLGGSRRFDEVNLLRACMRSPPGLSSVSGAPTTVSVSQRDRSPMKVRASCGDVFGLGPHAVPLKVHLPDTLNTSMAPLSIAGCPNMLSQIVDSVSGEFPNGDVVARRRLPSAGSASHALGQCKPCAWFHKPQGCANGTECNHCHSCPPGTLKQRKKDKLSVLRFQLGISMEASGGFRTQSEVERMSSSEFVNDVICGTAIAKQDDSTSIGSAVHGSGLCRPCAWFHKPLGCANGSECKHCHACTPGELKRRRKERSVVRRLVPFVDSLGPSICHGHIGMSEGIGEESPAESSETVYCSPSSISSASDSRSSDDEVVSQHESVSVGSALHTSGQCKPCAFVWRAEGCHQGLDCQRCHLCPPGELKRRRMKAAMLNTV